MDIQFLEVAECPGGNHVKFSLVVGGQARTFSTTKAELVEEFASQDMALPAIFLRIKSALKELGFTTAELTKLKGKSFKV
jgi:hypothetical protein